MAPQCLASIHALFPLHERSHILLVTRGHKYDSECLIRALRADPNTALKSGSTRTGAKSCTRKSLGSVPRFM